MQGLRAMSLAVGILTLAGGAMGVASKGAPRVPDAPGYPLAASEWRRIAVAPHLARYRAHEGWLIAVRAMPPAERIQALDTVLPLLESHLSLVPTDATGWVAYAQFSAMRGGRFQQAVEALRMSYYTGRYDTSVAMWRIAPVLWLLPLLPPDLQREVDAEIERMAAPWRTSSVIERLADAAAATGPEQSARVLAGAARVSAHSEAVITQRLAVARPGFFP